MPRRLPTSFGTRLLLVAAVGLVAPAVGPPPVAAQDADFLFQRPRVNLGLNLGWAMPRAGSDIFEETRSTFTVDEGAFDTFTLSGELAYRVNERLDVGLEVGYDRSEADSEYREFIGTDDRPILQTTRLTRRPVTLNVRAYLNDRGRAVSRFAWVPARWSPWVGAGAGVVWYSFEREGEFVDFQTLDIFRDFVESKGSGPTFHVMGGADVSLSPRFVMTGQIRYSWANAELDPFYYEGYEDIDLAGFRATAGIKMRL
ncbi:MAG: outer membrane beta-barrel protein [Gemmatimonadota bacterium]|jgi:hypothetical protein